MGKDPSRGIFRKLTDIDLSELQVGERLTIYRGSSSFVTGPGAAGYIGEATVTEVKPRSALFSLVKSDGKKYKYKLRFRDARIVRVPNGETTMLYVHARTARPTVTAYFTAAEYTLVKALLQDELDAPMLVSETQRRRHASLARNALDRMKFHDDLRA